mmetsp:Transcript_12736/g.19077  ORF Transcript_12736/g.19077 Transcript_12736/m.19077 type:complete len:347 (-) Transcript_12736:111-1151(-)
MRSIYLSLSFIIMVAASAASAASSSFSAGGNEVNLHDFHHRYQRIIEKDNDKNSGARANSFSTPTETSSLIRAGEISSFTSSILSLPRGGSSLIQGEETSNVVLIKLRNMIRSILQISERKNPTIANYFKKLIQTFESIIGVRLLPVVEKKKAAQKKKKKRSKVTDNEEEKVSPKTKTTSTSTKAKPSPEAQKHLSAKLKSNSPNYRIQKELRAFLTSPPPNLSVAVGKNIRVWIVTITGASNTIYEGEKYRLRMSFPSNYPTSPPSVYFLPPTPKHEHVYTNGDICLSLLGKDWRPTMTGQSLAVSILSLLSSAREKSLPMDNAAHSQNKPGGNQDNWIYHDDNC